MKTSVAVGEMTSANFVQQPSTNHCNDDDYGEPSPLRRTRRLERNTRMVAAKL